VIRELHEVVLTCDLPEQRLAAGEIGTVVIVHGEGRGYKVEFMTLDNATTGWALHWQLLPHSGHAIT